MPSAATFKPRLEWLLVLVPVVVGLEIAHAPPMAIFGLSAAAILPLAGLIGKATEDLALRTGQTIGGLLNATFGNVTEMIIAVFLLMEGQIEVVKASLTGAIIGNVLLILGLSFLIGGWSRTEQRFSSAAAKLHSTSLVIAVAALLMPALFALTPQATRGHTQTVSNGVAIVLIATYACGLLFSLRTHRQAFGSPHSAEADQAPRWSKGRALALLGGATVAVAAMSEILVGALEPTVEELGISKLFVGLIVVPIVGNAAEHSSALWLAAKDKMDVTIEIAIGSSTQIALFVAPVLVFVSLLVGHPMNLVFTGFEIAAVAFAAAILGFIVLDGRSTWVEGVQLLAAYTIMALSFLYL